MRESERPWWQRSVVFLDGATSTALAARGVRGYRTPELLNLFAPDHVLSLQKDYVAAGSQALLTNTFGANPFRLARLGHRDHLKAICNAAVRIAREAAQGKAKVLGDIGPMVYYAHQQGITAPDAIRAAYRETAEALLESGVDALFVETLPTHAEMKLALEALAPLAAGIPLFVSCYFRQQAQRFESADGVPAEKVIADALALGAAAAGANCCLGVNEMTAILTQLQSLVRHPWIAKPNAGLPRVENGKLIYPESAEDFAKAVPSWVELGARLIGGCCGTDPSFIAAMRKTWNARGG